MKLRFRRAAAAEVRAARRWYEQRGEDLGSDFAKELRACVAAIERGPQSFPLIVDSSDVRRALMTRFPYGLFFIVRGDAIAVLAVAHLRREPGYWKRRR